MAGVRAFVAGVRRGVVVLAVLALLLLVVAVAVSEALLSGALLAASIASGAASVRVVRRLAGAATL